MNTLTVLGQAYSHKKKSCLHILLFLLAFLAIFFIVIMGKIGFHHLKLQMPQKEEYYFAGHRIDE